MGFTKLDEGILQSSIMGEDGDVFKIWIAILAACKEDGIARVSPIYLSSVCKISIDKTMEAIKKLCEPDLYSRTKIEEGRRIRDTDNGFFVINYQKYRDFTYSSSAEAKKRRERRHKAKEEEQSIPWRVSFDEYKKEILRQLNILIDDKEWLETRSLFHPGMNIELSIQKAIDDYWLTEAGWNNKKKSRVLSIDLKQTLNNALAMQPNKVWLPKETR